jgi:hypothetical protein
MFINSFMGKYFGTSTAKPSPAATTTATTKPTGEPTSGVDGDDLSTHGSDTETQSSSGTKGRAGAMVAICMGIFVLFLQ